jgi:hypothetical protein
LEPLLQRLLILIVRGVFDGDGVVTFTDFVTLLLLALSLPLRIFCIFITRVLLS